MRFQVKGEKFLTYWNKLIMIGLPNEFAKSKSAHISPFEKKRGRWLFKRHRPLCLLRRSFPGANQGNRPRFWLPFELATDLEQPPSYLITRSPK
jgi:hypothetical protein